MYCPKCGHENQDDDRFCYQCGIPLKDPMDSNEVSNFKESNEENSKIKSLEGSNSSSSSQESSFINSNESNWNSPSTSPEPSKKGKFITIGLICLGLGIIGGGTAYFFFNGEEPREEAFSLEVSLKSESDLSISYSASSQKASSETTIASSEETSANSSASSQSTKVQSPDPWAGKYRTNYVMKVRKEPGYEGERIGRKEEGEIFEVVKSEPSSNNSIWGQLPDGGWICLKDDDFVYATEIQ